MDVVKFHEAVACFKKIVANFQIMNSSLQQSIITAVIIAIATAIAII